MAESDGDANINRDWSRTWEQFTLEHHSKDRVAFKSIHGKYLSCAPDGSVTADAIFMLEWEAFYIYKSTKCAKGDLGHMCIAIKSG